MFRVYNNKREYKEFDNGIKKTDVDIPLSPSQLDSAVQCAGYLFLDNVDSEAALAGREQHKIAEDYIKCFLEEIPDPKHKVIQEQTVLYMNYVIDTIKSGVKFFGFETKCVIKNYDTSDNRFSGLIDFWYIDKNNDLYIIDFKSGKSLIDTKNNSQLYAYAFLLIETLDKYLPDDEDTNEIYLGIHQAGELKVDTIDLDFYFENRREIMKILSAKEVDLTPGEHCGTCFKNTTCSKFKESAKVKLNFKTKDGLAHMNDPELAKLFEKAKEVEKYVKAVKKAVTNKVDNGEMGDYISKDSYRKTKVWKSKEAALKKYGAKILKKDAVSVTQAMKSVDVDEEDYTIRNSYTYNVIATEDDTKKLLGD